MDNVCFLDRDGVIINDLKYCCSWSNQLINIEHLNVIREINERFHIIIVTNQSGIGRGYFTENQYKIFTKQLHIFYVENGIRILDELYCPHKPLDNCSCRKPKSGLIDTAKQKFNINVSSSILIGDKMSDVQAGVSAGVPKNFLLSNNFNDDKIGQSIIVTKYIREILSEI